jgi:hypothetical protein
MSAEINYKNKYMELRAKYLNDLDMSFRLGFEQGGMQAQQDQMAQQQADQQAMEAQMQAQDAGGMPSEGGAPGQPGQPGQETGGAPGQPGEADGSELDQHIGKLESMLGKPGGAKPEDIQKSIQELKAFRKAELQTIELRKSAAAIKGIAKALHKPKFKMNAIASHNLKDNAKQAVSMQHKIVTDVMAKMEMEEKRATTDISKLLEIEGLTKK